jgi:hypothetical protein
MIELNLCEYFDSCALPVLVQVVPNKNQTRRLRLWPMLIVAAPPSL